MSLQVSIKEHELNGMSQAQYENIILAAGNYPTIMIFDWLSSNDEARRQARIRVMADMNKTPSVALMDWALDWAPNGDHPFTHLLHWAIQQADWYTLLQWLASWDD
jgi:hypothetical protein